MSARALFDKLGHVSVLVGWDKHDQDIYRRAFHRTILADLACRQGSTAVVLEAIPKNRCADVISSLRQENAAGLVGVLREYWGWPVCAYAELLMDLYSRGVEILPGGRELDPADHGPYLPGRNTPDFARAPKVNPDFDYERVFDHEFVCDEIVEWLQNHSGKPSSSGGRGREAGRVYVLFGADHASGFHGSIVSTLRRRGLDVAQIVLATPTVELHLHALQDSPDPTCWVMLGDRLFRPGVLTGCDWTRARDKNRSRFDWWLEYVRTRFASSDPTSVHYMLSRLYQIDPNLARPVVRHYMEMPSMRHHRGTLEGILKRPGPYGR